jgi:hypothetical protein
MFTFVDSQQVICTCNAQAVHLPFKAAVITITQYLRFVILQTYTDSVQISYSFRAIRYTIEDKELDQETLRVFARETNLRSLMISLSSLRYPPTNHTSKVETEKHL